MGLLSWTLALPIGGAIALAVFPKARHDLIRLWALGISLGAFGTALAVLARFDKSEAGFQLVERHQWIKAFGASYKIGVDGISLWLVVLTAFLFPICVLASWNVAKNPKLFMGLLLSLETAILGVFLSMDLLLFYVFWEGMLVPMYFLIGYWGYERRVYAAVKFFLYTLLGGLVMLAGIVVIGFQARTALGRLTFDYEQISQVAFSAGIQRWLFVAFFAAFAIKVPLFPFHTWLPDAHTEAPTAGSIILAGVLLKLGAFGFLRYSIPLFPDAAQDAVPYVAVLALIGIVYGALVCAMQRDLKRLIAYSSISHLGFVVLGIFVFTIQGLSGGTLQMISHGVSTGALFLLVGILYERRHTREIADFGGLAATMPVYAGLFLVVALSSLGLPGLNGFVGEFLVILGTWDRQAVWAIVAGTGVILAAIYLLWAYQRVFHGPITIEENRNVRDLSLREGLALAPLVALIVLMGVWPKPFLERMEPSLERVRARVVQQEPVGSLTVPSENGE